MDEKERTIEVKFDSSKEKIFIFLKPNTTIPMYDKLLELLGHHEKTKIFLLPGEFIDSVKVIKDVKK